MLILYYRTTIDFTTDFKERTINRDVNEEYKSDKYKFLPKKGNNPEVLYMCIYSV